MDGLISIFVEYALDKTAKGKESPRSQGNGKQYRHRSSNIAEEIPEGKKKAHVIPHPRVDHPEDGNSAGKTSEP